MTTDEHFDRIALFCALASRKTTVCDDALESITALREHIRLAEKDRDVAEHCQTVLGNECRLLRQRIASLEEVARTKEASPSTPPPSAEPPQTGSPSPLSRSDESESKSGVLLSEFSSYCREHPQFRFWQALRNWADFAFLYAKDRTQPARDTFHLDARNFTTLPIRVPHGDEAPATKGLPVSAAPTKEPK